MPELTKPAAASTKSVETAREQSLQARATEEGKLYGSAGFLLYLAHAGELVAPWWSLQRDKDLDSFWRQSDHVSGALGSLIARIANVPVRVLPRDPSVAAHRRQAEEFTIRLLEESDFGRGWVEVVGKWLLDFWAADNGGFWEVIGEDGTKLRSRRASELTARERRIQEFTTKPIVGPAQGLAHLDSLRCTRTGNPEYPVRFSDTDGRPFLYHWTRVAYASDLPSSRVLMFGVGTCALSRWINSAQSLVDIGVYKQEKLGSRPKRAIFIAKGIRTEQVTNAVRIADEEMDNRGLRRFSMNPIIGDLPLDADLSILDVASLPDGFNEETWTRLGMFTGALAFGVPIRWLWPAAVSGATKADAMYQHIAGLGGGVGKILTTITFLLGGDPRGRRHMAGKFLPPHLKLAFDFQDDEQDRMRAEISKTRAESRQKDLDAGIINLRVARERAMEAGDINESQFMELELDDGRLPDGSNVLGLFTSVDDRTMELLDLGVEQPLAVGANDPFDMLAEIDAAAVAAQEALLGAGASGEQLKARQALTALNELKKLYVPLATQEIQAELATQGEAIPPEAQAEAEKGFDYSVGVGEVIRGQLARGVAGRFINIAQLKEQIRLGIAARLAARSGEPGAGGAAASKRVANRAAVEESLGLAAGTMEAMAAMRAGTATEEQAAQLRGQGMTQTQPDGTETMTSGARSLLSAGNSGDADRAKEALAKAKEPPKVPKPKVTAEQRAAERERKRQAELGANRAKVAEALGDDAAGLTSLRSFAEGEELSPDATRDLASRGLVEVAPDGTVRLATAGRATLRAMDKGDSRAARDAVSLGKERAERELTRATEKRERADELAGDAEDRAAKDETKAGEVEADCAERAAEKREKSEDVLKEADKRSAKTLSRVDKTRQRAAKRAARLRAKGEDALAEEVEAEAEEKAAELEERAAEALEKARERADKLLSDADELERFGALRADDLRRRAEERRADAEERAAKLREEADTMEQSVGGAAGGGKSLGEKQRGREYGYGRDIRGLSRLLWNGTFEVDEFTSMMLDTISLGFRGAWFAGARRCGVEPEELTDEEMGALARRVDEETAHLAGFADYIVERNKASGGLYRDLGSRIAMWSNRYSDVRSQAMQMACADKKLAWRYDPAKEHCDDCARLDGRVYRASTWKKWGIRPRSSELACKGFRCGCAFEGTDERVTPGRPPGLKGGGL